MPITSDGKKIIKITKTWPSSDQGHYPFYDVIEVTVNSVVEVRNTGKARLGKKENLSHQPLMTDQKSVNGHYAKYALFVLMLVSLFNFLDRQITAQAASAGTATNTKLTFYTGSL